MENTQEIEDFILNTLQTVRAEFNDESINGVEHYVVHAEYEMAFEILFIEIMKLHKYPLIDFQRSWEAGLSLKLNKESVFDPFFWDKFKSYITQRL
jgi:hypothetical protein